MILHISDLHYGQAGAVSANARILNAIASRPDVAECTLVITGDINDTPNRAIYQTSTSALRDVCGRVKRVVMCDGNHDIDIFGLSRSMKGLTLFADQHKQLTGLPYRPPVACVDEEEGIAYLSVSTCVRASRRFGAVDILATGMIGEEQIRDICEAVKHHRAMGRRIVIAMHHCPTGGNPALRLSDRHSFGEALEAVGGVDLILTGHLHRAGHWTRVFGTRNLIASAKSPDSRSYTQIAMDGDRIDATTISA